MRDASPTGLRAVLSTPSSPTRRGGLHRLAGPAPGRRRGAGLAGVHRAALAASAVVQPASAGSTSAGVGQQRQRGVGERAPPRPGRPARARRPRAPPAPSGRRWPGRAATGRSARPAPWAAPSTGSIAPSPVSTSASSGSPADSPQTPIGRPAARRPRRRWRRGRARPAATGRAGRQLALHPVGGHRVLRQVVGADAAEVDLGQHVAGPQRRRRDLDHHPGLGQAVLADPAGEPGGLLGGGDHRRHDAHVGAGGPGGHGQRLELGVEQVRAQRPTGAARAGRGPGCSSGPEVGERQRLVGAGVQGADDHARGRRTARTPGGRSRSARSRLGALVGREEERTRCGTGRRPRGPGRAGGDGVLHRADVGQQRHAPRRRGCARARELAASALARCSRALGQLGAVGRVGVDHHLPGVAVEGDRRAGGELGRGRPAARPPGCPSGRRGSPCGCARRPPR